MAGLIVIRVKTSSSWLIIQGAPYGRPQAAIEQAVKAWLGSQLAKPLIHRSFTEIEALIRTALGPEMGGAETRVENETGSDVIGFNDVNVQAADP